MMEIVYKGKKWPTWWRTPLFQALKSQIRVDCEFQASPVYKSISNPARATYIFKILSQRQTRPIKTTKTVRKGSSTPAVYSNMRNKISVLKV